MLLFKIVLNIMNLKIKVILVFQLQMKVNFVVNQYLDVWAVTCKDYIAFNVIMDIV
jgi:hypothetical protein